MGLRKPKSIKHNGKHLTDILEAHERFFRGHDGGARADLTRRRFVAAPISAARI